MRELNCAATAAMISAGDQTVDDAVTSGKLTQQQGDAMKKRIANGDFFSFGRHHGRFGRAVNRRSDGLIPGAARAPS